MPIPIQSHGVRKVSESITQTGRALIITEEDDSKLDWALIPNGSLKVNPKTGIMSVKLEGETSWVPGGLKNDGTISIAKDSRINLEVFTIKTINGDGTFTYSNTEGQNRTKPLAAGGKPMFELEKGTYINMRNALEVFVNDDKYKNTADGSVIETDELRFSMSTTYIVGTKFTARYIQRFNIGTPYPRFYMSNTEPVGKESGDFWLDLNDTFLNVGDGPVLKWWDGTVWTSLNKNTHIYLSDKIAQEIRDRIEAVSKEAAIRLANDNTEAATRLANDNTEVATRLANDNALGIRIDNEITNRASADGILDDNVNAIQNTINEHIGTGGSSHALATLVSAGFMSSEQVKQLKGMTGTLSAINIGEISHGGFIPLPDGYTAEQCKWFVVAKNSTGCFRYPTTDNPSRYGTFFCEANESRRVCCYYDQDVISGSSPDYNIVQSYGILFNKATYVIMAFGDKGTVTNPSFPITKAQTDGIYNSTDWWGRYAVITSLIVMDIVKPVNVNITYTIQYYNDDSPSSADIQLVHNGSNILATTNQEMDWNSSSSGDYEMTDAIWEERLLASKTYTTSGNVTLTLDKGSHMFAVQIKGNEWRRSNAIKDRSITITLV